MRIGQDTRGYLMILALFTLTGIAMITTTALTRTMTEQLASRQDVAISQAFHLADGGLDDADQLLRTLPLLPAGADPVDPFTGAACDPKTNEPDDVARQHHMGSGYYLVCVDPDDKNATEHIDLFTVTVTSHTNNLTRTVSSILRTESFARFAYFTDNETSPDGGAIWFKTGEVIDGPLHTNANETNDKLHIPDPNDKLHISGNPVFDGPVSSVAQTIEYKHPLSDPPLDNPKFLPGQPRLGVPKIPMDDTALTKKLDTLKHNALLLSGDTTVVLDGTWMFVTNTGAGWLNHPVAVGTTQALFVEGGNLLLNGGILDGQLTLGSNEDIVIDKSVRYACDPETLPPEDPVDPDDPADTGSKPDDLHCKDLSTGEITYNDDLLGLVALNNVKISKDAIADVDPATETKTLSIQASIMAIKGSFKVEQHNVGPPKGTLHVFGGIIQKFRGPVGRFDSATGETTSGYSKHYHYDDRFLALSPPVYPTTGRLETVLWQEP